MFSKIRSSGVPSCRLSTSPHTVMRVFRIQASPPHTPGLFWTQLLLVVSVAMIALLPNYTLLNWLAQEGFNHLPIAQRDRPAQAVVDLHPRIDAKAVVDGRCEIGGRRRIGG